MTAELDARVTDFLNDSWDLPGKPMVCQALVIATFLDSEGEQRWAYFPMGEGDTSRLIGLLEVAKQQIVDEVLYGYDDEDEDEDD